MTGVVLKAMRAGGGFDPPACLLLIALLTVACHGEPDAGAGAAGPRGRGQDVAAQTTQSSSDPRGPVTFSRDIAPILFEHCSGCHRPGAAAPFSLISYEDARKRAPLIAALTADRSMPPWLPEPGYADYAGDPSLSQSQIALIQAWVAGGTLEGDPRELPETPNRAGWRLGSPDLIVKMPRAYRLPQNGGDVFRNFVIPVPLDSTRFVRAVDLRPGRAGIVHHAQLYLDKSGSAMLLEVADSAPGFDGMIHAAGVEAPDGFFLGWTPGRQPSLGQNDLAWRLDPGTRLVLMLHLRPNGTESSLRSEVGLYFAERAPKRAPALIKLSAPTIDIPAGNASYTIEDTFTLPVDVDALRVYPHAHYLAKVVHGLARLPDGDTRWLVRIDEWDFNWQDEYTFARPLELPKGTRLILRYTYDNSAANPRNPFRPPRRIVYGPTSSDEMGELLVQVVPRAGQDVELLRQALERKNAAVEVALREHQARLDPESAAKQYDLAIALQSAGRFEEAVGRYRIALALRPDFAAAHNNLGTALKQLGRVDEAIGHYRKAVEIDSHSALAYKNLGAALHAVGELSEAVRSYRAALRIKPEDAPGQGGLGFALAGLGEEREALTHFRQAMRLDPQWVAPRFAAAWLLATHPDETLRQPAEAVRLAERAAQQTEYADAMVLDALAAAYAAAGRWERAVIVAGEARDLAALNGATRLARDISERLTLYRRREAYRDR